MYIKVGVYPISMQAMLSAQMIRPDLEEASVPGPSLRKALETICPGWFVWDSENREKWAAGISEADALKIDIMILSDLLGVDASSRSDVEAALDAASDDEVDAYECERLPLYGVGSDGLCLVDQLSTTVSCAQDFVTVGGFERAMRRAGDDMAMHPGFEMNEGHVAMFREHGVLVRARIWSADAYVVARVEDRLDTLVGTLVPYEMTLTRKSPTARWVPAISCWLDARGSEHVLDLVHERKDKFVRELGARCRESFEHKSPCLFVEETEEHRNFVFSNLKAMDMVFLRNFIRDCALLRSPSKPLSHAVDEVGLVAERALRQAYAEIREAWPHNVVPFPRSADRKQGLPAWTRTSGS